MCTCVCLCARACVCLCVCVPAPGLCSLGGTDGNGPPGGGLSSSSLFPRQASGGSVSVGDRGPRCRQLLTAVLRARSRRLHSGASQEPVEVSRPFHGEFLAGMPAVSPGASGLPWPRLLPQRGAWYRRRHTDQWAVTNVTPASRTCDWWRVNLAATPLTRGSVTPGPKAVCVSTLTCPACIGGRGSSHTRPS